MTTVHVYDPPMCCPTGVCGPSPDPALVQFAADLAWLGERGIDVERFNLAQEPEAFVRNAEVLAAMNDAENPEALPLILVDGSIVSRGRYPQRAELAEMLGMEVER